MILWISSSAEGRLNIRVWLCPVRGRSWKVSKKFSVFGAPRSARRIMNQVSFDDVIIFHVLRSESGIVALAKVVSEVYEDNSDIYGKDRYPLRVKLDFMTSLHGKDHNPIPLSVLFGKYNDEFSIEPYLKGIVLAPVSDRSFENIKGAFQYYQTINKMTPTAKKGEH
jgi:hypothetical protein